MRKFLFIGAMLLLLFLAAMPVAAQDGTVSPSVAFDIGEIIAIVLGAGAMLLAFRKGDDAGVSAMQTYQNDRDYMTRLERLYEDASRDRRQMFDTIASIAKAVAPMTPIRADDQLVKLMEDVQRPGNPTMQEVADTTYAPGENDPDTILEQRE